MAHARLYKFNLHLTEGGEQGIMESDDKVINESRDKGKDAVLVKNRNDTK